MKQDFNPTAGKFPITAAPVNTDNTAIRVKYTRKMNGIHSIKEKNKTTSTIDTVFASA